ncbi:MAG: diacylglycerol kinase family lipid kinase, partial [Proteobacteria bacterium]|nr:diacylglycerol kinase family lipid kinase [Pseudomonadota bacterium]
QAGRGAGARIGPDIARYLSQHGFECEARITNDRGHATELAREAAKDGADCVAIAGGDGSVHETVNGLMQAGGTVPLAVMPVGTGNDFAKMLGSPTWTQVCDKLVAGHTRNVDIGLCNGTYFANGIGAGFDAKVARIANGIRWLRGNAVYGIALLRTLAFHHDSPEIHITTDTESFTHRMTMLAAANGRVYGGSFRIAPHASLDDGLLDVVLAENFSRAQILKLVPRVLRGTHLDLPGVHFLRTRSLKIEADHPLPVHADGEVIANGTERLEIDVVPGALNVVD